MDCKRRKARIKAAAQFAVDPERVRQRGRESLARRRADPERNNKRREVQRARRLQRDYGLTQEEYDSLFDQQLGFCAICHQAPGKRGLAVDHHHLTGKVRGLLCDRCNTGLGLFRDMPMWLRQAADYLDEHGGSEVRYLSASVTEVA